ncbi:hypothetical protein ADIS_1825 [Lunatimonas lonarensis]|uniref:Uncharacterized protein n=1 Tax=Lunatimonas lonarensis TaxID=1232681 RepID=R7ZTZ3_9BACT|nr:hypothetical protein ADIS_1825 [Lunatimonas lonarensis]
MRWVGYLYSGNFVERERYDQNTSSFFRQDPPEREKNAGCLSIHP